MSHVSCKRLCIRLLLVGSQTLTASLRTPVSLPMLEHRRLLAASSYRLTIVHSVKMHRSDRALHYFYSFLIASH